MYKNICNIFVASLISLIPMRFRKLPASRSGHIAKGGINMKHDEFLA